MKRIAPLLFLMSAAFGQSRDLRSTSHAQTVPAGREAKSHMVVSCVVVPAAVVRVPLITLNTNDLQAWSRPQQSSANPQIYWTPMMPSGRIASLDSLVTVNNKTALESGDIPFTATTDKVDGYIYFTITF